MSHVPERPGAEFRPYVPSEQSVAEFTPKAIVLGVFFGLLFGAATVYLALRAGLTVSASVPIAVLAIAVFKKIGKSTILENNIVQTIGSAGESVAAGTVFTVPALLFLAGGEQFFNYIQITILAIFGGIIGVLFMIPLRRALIVKEHGKLPYPEGTACADVLIAGEKGGNLAKMVFAGVGVSLLYKVLYGVLGLWNEVSTFFSTRKESLYPSSTLDVAVTPEYLGLGYIIGPAHLERALLGRPPRLDGAHPADRDLRAGDPRRPGPREPRASATAWRANNNYANWIYRAYIRYIGAGAVACAGVMTLIKTIPTIASAFKESMKSFGERRAGGSAKRTEQDMGMGVVIFGSLAILIILAILPGLPARAVPRVAPHVRPDRRLRFLLRHRLVPDRRDHRDVLQPDLRHDDRDPDGDVRRLRRHRLEGRRLPGGRALASARSCASRRRTPAPRRRT